MIRLKIRPQKYTYTFYTEDVPKRFRFTSKTPYNGASIEP